MTNQNLIAQCNEAVIHFADECIKWQEQIEDVYKRQPFMLILLSCAKTMSDVSKVKVPFTTIPCFQKEAAEIALEMSQFSVEELEHLLRVNPKIAVENYKRYQAFHSEDPRALPALLAYPAVSYTPLIRTLLSQISSLIYRIQDLCSFSK